MTPYNPSVGWPVQVGSDKSIATKDWTLKWMFDTGSEGSLCGGTDGCAERSGRPRLFWLLFVAMTKSNERLIENEENVCIRYLYIFCLCWCLHAGKVSSKMRSTTINILIAKKQRWGADYTLRCSAYFAHIAVKKFTGEQTQRATKKPAMPALI